MENLMTHSTNHKYSIIKHFNVTQNNKGNSKYKNKDIKLHLHLKTFMVAMRETRERRAIVQNNYIKGITGIN